MGGKGLSSGACCQETEKKEKKKEIKRWVGGCHKRETDQVLKIRVTMATNRMVRSSKGNLRRGKQRGGAPSFPCCTIISSISLLLSLILLVFVSTISGMYPALSCIFK